MHHTFLSSLYKKNQRSMHKIGMMNHSGTSEDFVGGKAHA
jgi:hypothetical protein